MQLLFITIGILASSFVCAFLSKKQTDAPGRATSILLQYVLLAGFALGVAQLRGNLVLPNLTLTAGILSLGFVNAVSCFAYWRASAISLSKSASMLSYKHIVAISFALVFLQELKYLNFAVLASIATCFIGSCILVRSTDNRVVPAGRNAEFTRCVILYSLGWGTILAATKYFASGTIAGDLYLALYYCGSALGAIGVYQRADGVERTPLRRKHVTAAIILAGSIYCSYFLVFWAYALAPLVVVQPILQLIAILVPLLSGLIIFRERDQLSKREMYGIGTSAAGSVALILSFALSIN